MGWDNKDEKALVNGFDASWLLMPMMKSSVGILDFILCVMGVSYLRNL